MDQATLDENLRRMTRIVEAVRPKLGEGIKIRATAGAVVLGFHWSRARDVKIAVRDVERAFAVEGILHYNIGAYMDELALAPVPPPKEG